MMGGVFVKNINLFFLAEELNVSTSGSFVTNNRLGVDDTIRGRKSKRIER